MTGVGAVEGHLVLKVTPPELEILLQLRVAQQQVELLRQVGEPLTLLLSQCPGGSGQQAIRA